MRFLDPTIHPMNLVLQRIEQILLGVIVIVRFTTEDKLEWSISNLYFIGFSSLTLLLSTCIPLEKPLWYRRIYAGLSMLVIILASVLGDGYDLLLYWNIIKISFLLDLRDLILAVSISGIVHISGLVANYNNIVTMAAQKGINLPVSPQLLMISQASSYTGASILCILLSGLLLAERRSRIKNAMLSEEVKSLAADLERQRIAREIHDSLGHSLAALDIQLELAQKFQKVDLSKTIQAINRAKNLTSQCLEDVRLAVRRIRPEPFDLHQSLQVLVDRFRPSFNVHVQLELPDLPFQASHQLYCILQEGFTNIQKHALPTEVVLRGNYDHQQLWIHLQDNGHGFEQTNVTGGFGLRSMAERAQLLGGQLHVESSPSGTHLSLLIPITAQ
jgi:signal transduction histidine kinase